MQKFYSLTLVFILFSIQLFAQSIYYVRSDGNDGNAGNSNTSSGAKATLASAVSVASAGDIIQIGPGSFSGSGFSGITLGTKYLKIIGSGNGSNPATSTVISGAGSGSIFLTMAAGASSTNRMEVWNINISGYSYFFDQVNSDSYFYNITVTGDSSIANLFGEMLIMLRGLILKDVLLQKYGVGQLNMFREKPGTYSGRIMG